MIDFCVTTNNLYDGRMKISCKQHNGFNISNFNILKFNYSKYVVETFVIIPKLLMLNLWTNLDVYPSVAMLMDVDKYLSSVEIALFAHECFLSVD
jgi:hypothetical protein